MRRIDRSGPAGDDSATDELADAWEYEVGNVSDVDAVEGGDAADAVVDGQEQLTPADSPEPEGERTRRHRKGHELPPAGLEHLHEPGPLHIAEREP